jgi:hypothetical protein
MFRKLFIALSIAAITAFLTPQIALAEMDHNHDQRASDPRSPCQLQGLADDFRDQRASDSWSPCEPQGLADVFRDQRANDWSLCQLQGFADDFRDQRAIDSRSTCRLQGLADDFRDQRASAPWSPRCLSVERHAIIVVDVAFFLNAENLAKMDARDCNESRALLFGVDGEPRIVSRDVNIPDEGVGGLDRGDPGQPAPWSAGPAMCGRRVPSGSAPAANRPDMFDAQMVESPARLRQARSIDLSASLWRVLTAYNFAKRLTTPKA